MGQALRRAMSRVPSSARTKPAPPLSPQNMSQKPEQVPPPSQEGAVAVQDRLGVSSPEDTSETKVESNILEERDPEYDDMLQKMVGTIRSKPGGKQEMGEALIVQKYKKPLPKIRSSKEEAGSDDQKKPVLPGTLTIAQLQEIILLHQGQSSDHKGPMDIQEIAKKFGIDAAQVQKIAQFVSMPPELQEKDTNKSN